MVQILRKQPGDKKTRIWRNFLLHLMGVYPDPAIVLVNFSKNKKKQ
jgi:hypothetical protein